MRADVGQGSQTGLEALADELVRRWRPLFVEKNWDERLEFLQLVLEQLQEDVADIATYAAISPVFVRKLIDALPPEPITCLAQAHIYANSDADRHRHPAGQWLEQYGQR